MSRSSRHRAQREPRQIAHGEGDGSCDRPCDRGQLAYSEHAACVDTDSPHAGQEINCARDEGNAMVLVSADGRERVITAKMV